MKPIKISAENEAMTAGVVTLLQYMAMADGENYLYVWAERWEIITDKAMPVPGFRSAEKWSLVGVAGGQVRVVIPGCQVKCWAGVEKNPRPKAIYTVV